MPRQKNTAHRERFSCIAGGLRRPPLRGIYKYLHFKSECQNSKSETNSNTLNSNDQKKKLIAVLSRGDAYGFTFQTSFRRRQGNHKFLLSGEGRPLAGPAHKKFCSPLDSLEIRINYFVKTSIGRWPLKKALKMVDQNLETWVLGSCS